MKSAPKPGTIRPTGCRDCWRTHERLQHNAGERLHQLNDGDDRLSGTDAGVRRLGSARDDRFDIAHCSHWFANDLYSADRLQSVARVRHYRAIGDGIIRQDPTSVRTLDELAGLPHA